MDYHNIYKKVESFVRELYEKNQTGNLLFHTLEHTENVVDYVKEIAAQSQLTDREQFILYTAAWFHDTGHFSFRLNSGGPVWAASQRNCIATKEES